MNPIQTRLIAELKPVVHGGEPDAHHNYFSSVSAHDLEALELYLGYSLPTSLREFYTFIGSGHLVRSRAGAISHYHPNAFLQPSRIRSVIEEEVVSIGGEYGDLESGDLPVFDMGENSFLVMRPLTGEPDRIFWPYDLTAVAGNIWEFVDQLLDDPTFYLKDSNDTWDYSDG